MSQHHRNLERMYLHAPINQRHDSLSMVVSEGRAEVGARVHPGLHHAAGTVHGSYLFELLDDAAFFAASSVVDDVFIVTASFNIQFLRRVEDGLVHARGRLIKRARNMLFADASLVDARGRELACGSGVFAMTTIDLRSVQAYLDAT